MIILIKQLGLSKNNYPQDLAYNFKVGDLRGMYSIFIPQIQQALQ